MAIVPLLYNLARDLKTDYSHEMEHLLDDDFGFGIHPLELLNARVARSSLMLHPRPRRRFSPYERNWMLKGRGGGALRARAGDAEKAVMSSITKDGFQVCMDVSQFKPNELSVKTVDNCIVVEGNHEEREDEHGFMQRYFVPIIYCQRTTMTKMLSRPFHRMVY